MHTDLPDEIAPVTIVLAGNCDQIGRKCNQAATEDHCSYDKPLWKPSEVTLSPSLFPGRQSERGETYEGSQRRSRKRSNFIVVAGYVRRGDASEVGRGK